MKNKGSTIRLTIIAIAILVILLLGGTYFFKGAKRFGVPGEGTPAFLRENGNIFSDSQSGMRFFYYPEWQLQVKNSVTDLAEFSWSEPNFPEQKHFLKVTRVSTSPENYEKKLIDSTIFDASGLNPSSFGQFSKVRLGKHDFYFIRTGLFEAVLSVRYALVTPRGIFAFDLASHGVPDWMEPSFNADFEPGHRALRDVLSTIEFVSLSAEDSSDDDILLAYENLVRGYSFQYSKNLLLSSDSNGNVIFNFPRYLTQANGTNLASDSTIGVFARRAAVCEPSLFLESGNDSLSKRSARTLNGVVWDSVQNVGAAAGNRYDFIVYSTKQNALCYGIRLGLHTLNIENFPEGQVVEFDNVRVKKMYDQILESFTFSN